MSGDGGPAFPAPEIDTLRRDRDGVVVGRGGRFSPASAGMSLRDYFAAKALVGLLGDQALRSCTVQDLARWAYSQADAMLAERAKESQS